MQRLLTIPYLSYIHNVSLPVITSAAALDPLGYLSIGCRPYSMRWMGPSASLWW